MSIVSVSYTHLDVYKRQVDGSTWTSRIMGAVAVALAAVNIFGGFLVTERMLSMYKKKEKPAKIEGGAK